MLADEENALFNSQANSGDDDEPPISDLAPLPELTKELKRKLVDQLFEYQINSQLDQRLLDGVFGPRMQERPTQGSSATGAPVPRPISL